MREEETKTVEYLWGKLSEIRAEVGKVIIGQAALVDHLLIALFSKVTYSFKSSKEESSSGCGHVLLEGVPGLAKTLAVTAISRTISATFRRIQFTPDLLPADIIGTRVFDLATSSFHIEQGPIFANIILADEVNRGTPKTQSALLEAMQERQVTISEQTFKLLEPFWVLATQNPLEEEGVYALPEAQLDRFSMKIIVDYPSAENEEQILTTPLGQYEVRPVITPEEVRMIQDLTGRVFVGDEIYRYIARLGRATRNSSESSLAVVREMVLHGASTRALQQIVALARTRAFFSGRNYVLHKDVKHIATEALQHRLIRTLRSEAEGITVPEIVSEILKKVPLYG
ncbi:MAG: AAA family ATPase [Acidobacteria bacterium]|nr:AAA family ATPase [Acidobacteriota bacterium]